MTGTILTVPVVIIFKEDFYYYINQSQKSSQICI